MMNARRSARTRSKFFSLPFRMAGQPTNLYLMINTEMRRRNRTKRTQRIMLKRVTRIVMTVALETVSIWPQLSRYIKLIRCVAHIVSSFAAANTNIPIPFLTQKYVPAVRSSEEDVEKCFKKCGDKNADDADKISECQVECVDDEVSNGRSRSNIGPRGKHINSVLPK
jgi:hypothetical protein